MDAGRSAFSSIAAHGHADCLSLLLSVSGKELLVDPGTYCYHTEREWRDYFRSTAAHNTVRVDGVDQSQIAGAFLWAEKAEASVEGFETSPTRDWLRAKHSGYRRLADPVTHVREVIFDKTSRTIDVVDEIRCAGRHRVERFWHFAEQCAVALDGGRRGEQRLRAVDSRNAGCRCGGRLLRGERADRRLDIAPLRAQGADGDRRIRERNRGQQHATHTHERGRKLITDSDSVERLCRATQGVMESALPVRERRATLAAQRAPLG